MKKLTNYEIEIINILDNLFNLNDEIENLTKLQKLKLIQIDLMIAEMKLNELLKNNINKINLN